MFGNRSANRIPALFLPVRVFTHYNQQVHVAMLSRLVSGMAAEEDNQVWIKALNDQFRYGPDSVSVNMSFDRIHYVYFGALKLHLRQETRNRAVR